MPGLRKGYSDITSSQLSRKRIQQYWPPTQNNPSSLLMSKTGAPARRHPFVQIAVGEEVHSQQGLRKN
jgi:hypothetical protein